MAPLLVTNVNWARATAAEAGTGTPARSEADSASPGRKRAPRDNRPPLMGGGLDNHGSFGHPALATAKIPGRRTPFNFQTRSNDPHPAPVSPFSSPNLREVARHSPLRGCSARSASPKTKIPRRSTAPNFQTGSKVRATGPPTRRARRLRRAESSRDAPYPAKRATQAVAGRARLLQECDRPGRSNVRPHGRA